MLLIDVDESQTQDSQGVHKSAVTVHQRFCVNAVSSLD